MRKKKQNKIVDEIILSIKYSRLKEEIRDTEKENEQLDLQRKIIGSNNNKISANKKLILVAEDAIYEIERKYSPRQYRLFEDNNIEEQLALLSNLKNFKFLKYFIALNTVLDNTFTYTDNTKFDFIAKVSKVLFNNEDVMVVMQKDVRKISSHIKGTRLSDGLDEIIQAAKNIGKENTNIPKIIKEASRINVKALFITGSVGFGIAGLSLIVNHQLKMQARKTVKFEVNEFASKLIVNAVNIKYSKSHLESEKEYRMFFKNTLKEINFERKLITKQMFEDQLDIENNILRLKLLNNFDNFIIDKMNLRGNK